MYRLKKQFVQAESEDSLLGVFSLDCRISSEQVLYEGTPFFIIYHVLELINTLNRKVIYDLGSGYGRFVIAGSLKYTDSHFKGIELLPVRARVSTYFVKELELKNASIIEGNVLNFDLSDGDIFFLFNPFSYETLGVVIDMLKVIASKKNIAIIAIGDLNKTLVKQNWLSVEAKRGFKYKGVDMWVTYLYKSIK